MLRIPPAASTATSAKFCRGRLNNSNLHWRSANSVSNVSTFNNFESKSFKNKKNFYNVVARRSGDVAIAQLNADYKHNTLDSQMMQEIMRFLESYEIDSSVRAVLLENSKEGGVFSKGTDFKHLMNKIQNGEPHKAFDYLRDLYEFSIFMGKYNKPLLVNLNGSLSGSAASIFSRLPFSMGSRNTRWSLNETSLGYIPDAGASYYLSRLNNEFGAFVALTGWEIDGFDLSRSGIAFERLFLTHQNIEANWKHAHAKHDQETTSQDLYGKQKYIDQTTQEIFREQYFSHLNDELFQRIHKKDNVQFRNENKRLAMAEIIYRHQLQDRANLGSRIDDEFTKSHQILNRLSHYEEFVMFDLGLENIEMNTSGSITSVPLHTIARCFSANTVEEIMIRLEADGSLFARKALKSLKAKSPIALKLTLQLIREAENSSWKECFNREFRVACRRLLDPELQRSIEAQIFGERVAKNGEAFGEWDVKDLASISRDHVESYFQPFSEENRFQGVAEFDGSLKENCFYPTKDFYAKYPDTVRAYLNQDNLRDSYQRESMDHDVHAFLQSHQINSRNPAVDAGDVREKFYLSEKLNQKKLAQLNRISAIGSSEAALKQFYESRANLVDAYFSNEAQVEAALDNVTANLFEEFRAKRLAEIKQISRVAAVEKKQDFFMQLRQKIIDERLTKQDGVEDVTIENFPGIQYPLFFPHDNAENIVEAHNPYVKSLFRDLLDKIDIESQNSFVKNFAYDIEKVDKVLEKKKFGKTVIDRLNLFGNDRKRSFNIIREQYELRYGDARGATQTDAFYDSLIESGYKVDGIREFLSKTTNEEVKEILKKNNTDNLRDYVHEFLSELPQRQSIFASDEEIESVHRDFLAATQKGVSDYSNLVTLGNSEKKDPQQFHARSQEYSLELFKKYVRHDPELEATLSLILDSPTSAKSKNSIVEKTRVEMQRLLATIINSKLEQIYGKYNVRSCLMTENGEKYYQFDHAYMSRFDNYIHENLEFDIQQYISSHTLFMLGAFGLQRLEQLFRRIYNATRKANSRNSVAAAAAASVANADSDAAIASAEGTTQSSVSSLLSVFREYGMEITSPEELQELTEYLNTLTTTFASLYSGYKSSLIFSEDKALEMQNRAKFIQEREHDELSFTNYAVMAYEQKEKFLNGLSELTNSSQLPYETKENVSQCVRSIQRILDTPLKQGESKESHIDYIREELAQLDSLKERKTLITGFIPYAEKLDRLTQASIQGKGHYLPEHLQIEAADANIPQVFEGLDARMNPQEWLDAKIKGFVKKIFEQRYQQEKTLNHHDLLMLDFEIAKYLSPKSLRQSVLEQLDRDVETVRVCHNFESSQHNRDENNLQDFIQSKQSEVTKIRNVKAQEKLQAFTIWRNNKYAKEDPTSGEFEQMIKIEGELLLEQHLAPSGQIETDKEIEKVYLQLLDIPDFSDIDQTRITKEKTLINEYKLSIETFNKSVVIKEGEALYDDIQLFIKQISA